MGREGRMGKTGSKTLPSRFLIQWEREREKCTQIREVEKEREPKKKRLGMEATGSTVSHWGTDT